ncbi:MAG: ferrous iron transport protein B [Oscillospiraceae bacterium]|nr:ferrous iron transport protein B [Oscillospiraceae bacterium]
MADMSIALLGQPNSGKSTLYNRLTGSHQHVGNWPGKTVEKNEGTFTHGSHTYNITDLPGTYSLAANSDEEIVTRDFIASGSADLIIIMSDASQLERSLFMLADYAGINVPCMLILNMMDVSKEMGRQIDTDKISKRLGIPVLPFTASDKNSYEALYDMLEKDCTSWHLDAGGLEQAYADAFGSTYSKAVSLMPEGGIGVYSPAWLFSKLAEGDEVAKNIIGGCENKDEIIQIVSGIENGAPRTGNCKFTWIESIIGGAVTEKKGSSALSKFDRLATSKVGGTILAVAIALGAFIGSVILGYPLMALGGALPALGQPLAEKLLEEGAHPLLVSILCEGILTAVAFTIMMCGYIFGATFVFGLIEDVGYMARISYIFDGAMKKLGLHGKAVMPFLVSFGCNIGGATSSRVLDNWGQRVMAIALSWVVPCASTWGVVGLIATLFFGPAGAALTILGLLAVSVLHLIITSKVFGKSLIKESDRTGLIMELPPYHKPKWGSLLSLSLTRMAEAFKRAIAIVTIVSVVICLLSYSSTGNIHDSIIYKAGSAIEPVTLFFGLRWQTFTAWIASWMGKEGSLGAIAALFNESSVMTAIAQSSSAPLDNNIVSAALSATLSKPEALAFVFAFYFNMPCLMALSASVHETHSLKWTLKIAGYYVCMSLLISCIVYHLALLIW